MGLENGVTGEPEKGCLDPSRCEPEWAPWPLLLRSRAVWYSLHSWAGPSGQKTNNLRTEATVTKELRLLGWILNQGLESQVGGPREKQVLLPAPGGLESGIPAPGPGFSAPDRCVPL